MDQGTDQRAVSQHDVTWLRRSAIFISRHQHVSCIFIFFHVFPYLPWLSVGDAEACDPSLHQFPLEELAPSSRSLPATPKDERCSAGTRAGPRLPTRAPALLHLLLLPFFLPFIITSKYLLAFLCLRQTIYVYLQWELLSLQKCYVEEGFDLF